MATHKLLLLPGDGNRPRSDGRGQTPDRLDQRAQGLAKFRNRRRPCRRLQLRCASGRCHRCHHGARDGCGRGSVRRGRRPKWDKSPSTCGPESGLLRLRKESRCSPSCALRCAIRRSLRSSHLRREIVRRSRHHDRARVDRRRLFPASRRRSPIWATARSAPSIRRSTTPTRIERNSRVAFDLARKRKNKVTSMEKRNVMKTGVLWYEVVNQLHQREFKDVQLEHQLAMPAACSSSNGPSSSTSSSPIIFRRHAVGYRGHAHGLDRHAGIGLARRRPT